MFFIGNYVPVFLDTSIIIHAALSGIDLIEEIATVIQRKCIFVLLTNVLEELHSILSRCYIYRRRVIEKFLKYTMLRSAIICIRSYPSETTDDIVLRAAITLKGYLASDDKELRRRAKILGVPIIFFSSKYRRVMVIGGYEI